MRFPSRSGSVGRDGLKPAYGSRIMDSVGSKVTVAVMSLAICECEM